MLNRLTYCLHLAIQALTRNFWMAVASAGMITVSLGILGSFLLVAINASQLMKTVESSVEINVFLVEDADKELLDQRIRQLDGIQSCVFVSKERALEEMREALGENKDILDGLEEDNPLPDGYRIKAERAELVPVIAGQIQEMPGIKKVRYGQGWVEKLIAITRWLNVVSLAAAGLLAVAAVFLIVTTVRLSVVARQQEVSVMKFLGASNWFVRLPFLMEGMAVGLIGALVSTAFLAGGYYYLTLQVEAASLFFLELVNDPQLLVPVFTGLVLLGLIMGGLGSMVSIRKFLNV
ncbi:MAG: permease-like cell division protein FtsX [Bacillota bacterium]|uniref:permease-like cell division protein FtsX n=1 Tax=Desulforudis sp. DRI-14 TaxID=3459793 RepID=UPI0034813491